MLQIGQAVLHRGRRGEAPLREQAGVAHPQALAVHLAFQPPAGQGLHALGVLPGQAPLLGRGHDGLRHGMLGMGLQCGHPAQQVFFGNVVHQGLEVGQTGFTRC